MITQKKAVNPIVGDNMYIVYSKTSGHVNRVIHRMVGSLKRDMILF